ncbi:MAG: hypothetical protein Q4G33_00540 [bacterium]|nr:hypothetical protein [bacterium]
MLIEAVYNDDGSLNKLITYPVTTVNTPIQVSTDFNDGNVKFMLWNSLKGMTPMADAVGIK